MDRSDKIEESSSLDDIEKDIEKDLPVIKNASALYNALIGMTHIEEAAEEDFVLRNILRGVSKNAVLKKLKQKHGDKYKFSAHDLDKFLSKNPEIYHAMGKKVELAASRYLKAKELVSNRMANLVLYTENLIPQLREEGDNTNTIGAIRALQNAYMNYAQLEGWTKNDDGNKVQVNLIQQLSEGKGTIKDRVKDVDYSIEDDE